MSWAFSWAGSCRVSDMGCRRSAIATAPNVECETVPLGQGVGIQAMFEQCGDVHKNIAAVILADKAKSAGGVEHFQITSWHKFLVRLNPTQIVL